MARLDWNRGQRYEYKMFRLLYDRGYLTAPEPGTPGGTDSGFMHNGNIYKLEIKRDLSADYGQKALMWNAESGWHWAVMDTMSDLLDYLDALEYLNRKDIKPLRYTKQKMAITYEDARTDQRAFEDSKLSMPSEALWTYYGRKDIHYIQVGSGYGFYHLDKDVANLGTSQFDVNLKLRFRAKYHNHKLRKTDEIGNILKSTPTPWNYSFFAVLKVISKPEKSKYNLEPGRGQKFPPLKNKA